MSPKSKDSGSVQDKLAYQIERYKAQNELLIQAYNKIHKTLDQLKKVEDLLVESEKMALLGEMMATVTHEIKSPLGAISAANNIINDFTLSLPFETFQVARMLTEEEYKAIVPLMSISIDQSSISPDIKNSHSLVDKLKKLGCSIPSEKVLQTILNAGLGKLENLDPLKTILKSPNSIEILEYLGSLYMLKTSIWIVSNSIRRAAKLVDSLKSYSYNTQGQQVIINLPKSISNILTIYQSKLGSMEIIREFDEVAITGDPDRLSQVWINLISNAAQASNYKGKIEISIGENDEKKWISIKDYAGGIPKDIQNKIFQPFFTTKERGEGTGLGLPLVKRIVEEHKGYVHINVQDDVGTEAIVEFKK